MERTTYIIHGNLEEFKGGNGIIDVHTPDGFIQSLTKEDADQMIEMKLDPGKQSDIASFMNLTSCTVVQL